MSTLNGKSIMFTLPPLLSKTKLEGSVITYEITTESESNEETKVWDPNNSLLVVRTGQAYPEVSC